MLKGLITLAALAAATTSTAASTRLSDVQFLQASRCAALMTSTALGGGDGAAMKALLKAQRQGRVDYIYGKADEMALDAGREARHAGDTQRAKLIAERDGVCHSFIAEAQTAAGASSAPHTAD